MSKFKQIIHFIKAIVLLTIIAFSINVKAQTAPFDVINYDAKIQPDLTNKTVKGEVSIQFISLKDNLIGIQLNAGSLEIDSIREGKHILKFEKKDSLLNITLVSSAKLNEKRIIHIIYHGIPKYGVKFYPEQSQVYTVFSTSQWMPCVDAPSDRATFHLNLITSKDSKVVGNGRFIKQINLPDNKISSVWEQKIPVSTYLFGFAAGNFREIIEKQNNITFRYLASPQFTETEIKQIFRDTADMIDFYQEKAGIKYADKVYTQVLALGGAEQEMSSFTALNEDYGRGVLKDQQSIWLGAHEFAHQWWGNMVTNYEWTHFWLNEGITNFMTAAYLEHRFGRTKYLAQIEEYHTSYENVRAAGKDKSLVFPDWNKPTREDRRIVYNKGAYVTHLLREEMGDAAFWKGFKAYTQKYWGKSVTTIDFQQTMEKSSGKDLSNFFNKWVYLKN